MDRPRKIDLTLLVAALISGVFQVIAGMIVIVGVMLHWRHAYHVAVSALGVLVATAIAIDLVRFALYWKHPESHESPSMNLSVLLLGSALI